MPKELLFVLFLEGMFRNWCEPTPSGGALYTQNNLNIFFSGKRKRDEIQNNLKLSNYSFIDFFLTFAKNETVGKSHWHEHPNIFPIKLACVSTRQ